MKKPTLVAVSSMVAMTVPLASEKITTSEMRKDIIRPNVADIQHDVKDIPTLDTPNPEKTVPGAVSSKDNPDLITVELNQNRTGTQISKDSSSSQNSKNMQQKPEEPSTVSQNAVQPETFEIQKEPISNPERVKMSSSEIISLSSDELSFHKNSIDLKKEAYPVLRDVKDYIEKNDFLVSIIGYTDTSGMASYNKRLSRRRAEVVSSKLIELGLSKDRVVGIIGRGENNPAENNDTGEGRGKNRRVEFRFVKKGQV